MSLPVDSIALHARLSPARFAARDLSLGQSWSYAGLDRLTGRLSALLRERGCEPGERVATLARNSVWLVALHFACSRIGAVYAPLNWRLGASELRTLIDLASPRLLLGDAMAGGLPEAVALDAFVREAESREPLTQDLAAQPDRLSLLLFTSGTSGKPKGVMLTEDNLLQTAINFGVCARVAPDSSFLCEAPMFHVIGLVTNVRPALTFGASIQVSEGFEPERTLGWLSDPQLGISHYVGVPQMIEALRSQPHFDPAPLRRLTALIAGGAPHAPEAIAAWLDDGVAMASGFGMSEAGTVFGTSVDREAIRARLGSVGLPGPSVQARVVDIEGRDCPPGAPGELRLRGPNLFIGYWQDSEASARAFDADGWFATGDVVRRDEEGFFWIVDRMKDMYISGGENVYPAEIESALSGYPGIAQCAVVGVPDRQWGEAGYLAIVASNSDLREDEVLAFLSARLARYKLPRHVRIVSELPRTATGKLQKARLREMFRESEY
ncbi:AMP-binding protein [Brenneria populi subsp. brevivirga]|uniref:AMP-binding protein n=1 Tax=Brenneria populi TaxID=1505588 RepID=UPI002E17CB1C|nr:AMP-binding protein [Brenneria populi subsp. brevivirga]